jgi:adenylate cyclase class 2
VISNNCYEIEIKIQIEDTKPIKKKITARKYSLVKPRCLEKNIVFDRRDSRLKEKGILLRLRQSYGQSTLTLKQPMVKNQRFKIRKEIEVQVSDFENTKMIFDKLGYFSFFIYEKYRETYKKGDCFIMIDETPIGNFIEIEGPEEEIDTLAKELGFHPRDYITLTYYQLFKRTGRKGNMTFRE